MYNINCWNDADWQHEHCFWFRESINPFWKQSCSWAAKLDSAAMPTSSGTSPSPICLSSSGFGNNAFHCAPDKQNSRWASQLHRLQAPGSLLEPNTPPTVCFICAIAGNHWTGDYIGVYLHHIVHWYKGKSSDITFLFFSFSLRPTECSKDIYIWYVNSKWR